MDEQIDEVIAEDMELSEVIVERNGEEAHVPASGEIEGV
jgi:hypothetical protein